MSCVLCESYNVQNELGYGCALCDVQRDKDNVDVFRR